MWYPCLIIWFKNPQLPYKYSFHALSKVSGPLLVLNISNEDSGISSIFQKFILVWGGVSKPTRSNPTNPVTQNISPLSSLMARGNRCNRNDFLMEVFGDAFHENTVGFQIQKESVVLSSYNKTQIGKGFDWIHGITCDHLPTVWASTFSWKQRSLSSCRNWHQV